MPSATVTTSAELRNAIQLATTGDVITLSGSGPFSVGTLAKLPSYLPTSPGGDYTIVGDGTQVITNTRIYQANIDGPNAPGIVKDLNLDYNNGTGAILRATTGSYTVDNVSFTGTHTGWAGNGNNYITLTVSNPLTATTSTNSSTLIFKNSDVSINGISGNGFNGTSGGAAFIQSWNNQDGGVVLENNVFDESGYLAAFHFYNSPSANNSLGDYMISGNIFNRTSNKTVRSRGERLENVSAELKGNTFNDGSYLQLNGNVNGIKLASATSVNTFNTIAGGYAILAQRQGSSGALLSGVPMFTGTTVITGSGLALKYDSSITGSISYSGLFNVGGSIFDRLTAGSQVAESISLGGALSTTADWVNGDDGNDTINSGGGNDFVLGGAGNDSISGIAGEDTIEGGIGADTLNGGAGTADVLSYASSSAAVNINLETPSATGGDATGDVISFFENILGSAFDDTLTGDGSANTIFGGAGNDTIDGGGASDCLNGDAGDDSILGGLGADTLLGGTGNDTLDGGVGNDSILGGDGNDFIIGGDGTDTLTGGLGNDIFAYDLVANRVDTITDFTTAADKLYFKSSAFGGITPGGLPSANFQTGTSNSATTPSGTPTFVFNTTTKTLWYDSDGAGGLGSNQMANLPGVTSLSFTDITIF